MSIQGRLLTIQEPQFTALLDGVIAEAEALTADAAAALAAAEAAVGAGLTVEQILLLSGLTGLFATGVTVVVATNGSDDGGGGPIDDPLPPLVPTQTDENPLAPMPAADGAGGRDGNWNCRIGGATNRAAFEDYTDSLRAAMERPYVRDQELSRLLDYLYRPGATVGSGSTAAAVRAELANPGTLVGGRSHIQKAEDAIRSLSRWLRVHPEAVLGDRAAAENVIRDLTNALGGC